MKQKITLFILLMCCVIFVKAQDNLALNKIAVASSGVASAAVDGNPGSRWESIHNVDPQWIYVDLGATYNISQVKILWEGAMAEDYVIEVSNDTETWGTPIVTATGNNTPENDWTGLTAAGRYVRVYGTKRLLPYGYSIYELEVYGTFAGGNYAPSVSITTPGNNANFPQPANINIAANAADTDGTISKVEFYNGNDKIGEALTAPYSFEWQHVMAGTYSITAKATDNTGDFTISSPITVLVNLPVIIPTCGGLGFDSDYTYAFSWDNDNPTITFIPNPNMPTTGDQTLIFYYGTDPDATMGGTNIKPNVPHQITANQGDLIYFYFTYSIPAGGEKNNMNAKHSFEVGSCNTVNLAKNKDAFVSSGDAALAVDGNIGTRWESAASDPQWIYVDLGESYNINRVKITWESARSKDYVIEVSDDINSWGTPVLSVTDNPAVLEEGTTNRWIYEHSGLSATGRYVRIYATSRMIGYGHSIWELEVYGTPDEGTLPVSLIDFTAKTQTNGTVSLNWSTASEQGNNYFLLERSADGKNFSSLTEVPSKGSNSNYQFTDAQPLNGNNYYRLTQVDKDGKSKELSIQSVSVSLAKQNSNIYPNPLKGNTFYITLGENNNSNPVTVTVSSLVGKEVYKGSFTSSDIKVELASKLPSGIYTVKAGAQQTFKLYVE
ncbi:discoidin domain-containing protein [Pseudopedobacter beijingensis]|uniref:Discoidin domain-containing protein n=1 Tax=Pseudopedobacter beijingensis TaxID=1207056 RepID=A0ABW4ID92_9SPHI